MLLGTKMDDILEIFGRVKGLLRDFQFWFAIMSLKKINAVRLLLQSYNNNFYANDDVEED